MENLNKKTAEQKKKKEQSKEEKRRQEKKIDDQLDSTFPASDPPSYSKPGNELPEDDYKDKK